MKTKHKYLLAGAVAVVAVPAIARKFSAPAMSVAGGERIADASNVMNGLSGAATGATLGTVVNIGSKLLGFTPVGRVLTIGAAGAGWLLNYNSAKAAQTPSDKQYLSDYQQRQLADGSVVTETEYQNIYQGTDLDTWQNGVTNIDPVLNGATGTW